MQVKETRIAHITDLHVGIEKKGNRRIIAKPNGPGIATVLKPAAAPGGERSFDLLLITGDLIQASDDPVVVRERYALAKKEIVSAMRVLRIPASAKKDVIILPGNHDVVRSKNGRANPEGLDLFLEFLNDFYSPAAPPLAFKVQTDSKGSCELTRSPWCIERHGVVLWPLFSCTLSTATNTDGVIDHAQIIEGALDIKQRTERDIVGKPVLVVTHHNFFPAFQIPQDREQAKHRSARRNEGYPRGGMEGLIELFRDGADVVLHGHRHQEFVLNFGDWDRHSSPVEQNRLVAGAPSIGYYESGRRSMHDYAGFNTMTLIHSEASSRLELSKYEIAYDSRDFVVHALKPRNVTLRRLGRLREFLEFKDGYDSFVRDSLCPGPEHSSREVNILHYHDDTSWDNAYFRFWGSTDHDNGDTISRALNDNWLKPYYAADVLSEGYITKKLIKALRMNGVGDIICDALSATPGQHPPSDPFSAHLHRLATESEASARTLAYIAESIICAIKDKCHITKHVHLRPSMSRSGPRHQKTEAKFRWLCESLLLVRDVNGFDFTWLPFSIRDYEGKSLVGITEERDNSTAEIYYVGFNPQPLSYSVLRLPVEVNCRTTAEGPILSDLKAVMRKVINPLAALLSSEFSILTDGHLNLPMLDAMAKATGMDSVWRNDYRATMQSAFTGKVVRPTRGVRTILRRLTLLYAWVAKDSAEGIHLPWSATDKEVIHQNLEST